MATTDMTTTTTPWQANDARPSQVSYPRSYLLFSVSLTMEPTLFAELDESKDIPIFPTLLAALSKSASRFFAWFPEAPEKLGYPFKGKWRITRIEETSEIAGRNRGGRNGTWEIIQNDTTGEAVILFNGVEYAIAPDDVPEGIEFEWEDETGTDFADDIVAPGIGHSNLVVSDITGWLEVEALRDGGMPVKRGQTSIKKLALEFRKAAGLENADVDLFQIMQIIEAWQFGSESNV